MAEGQRAALAVHAAISGEAVELPDWTRTDYDRSTPLRAGIAKAARRKVPHIAIARRRSGFAEVEARYREKDAIAEASRCLQCGICCECGACVAACGEARAIDHAGTAPTRRAAAARRRPHRRRRAGRGGRRAPALRRPGAGRGRACSSGCATTRARRCRRGAGRSPRAPGVHVFLCTCNDSVHHRDLIEPLAAEARALPGVTGATILNAACQQRGRRGRSPPG